MICEHWDVVSVPFPFMERPAVKRRPALVISSREFNFENDHSVLAMITAAMLDRWPSDYLLKQFLEAGLRHACYVRWKVFTLPNSMIAKRMGALADEDRKELMKKAQMTFIQA